MRKNSKVAIWVMIGLFIIVFALVVPSIAFRTKDVKFSVFADLTTVRAWIEANGDDVQDVGKDAYLGEKKTLDTLNVTFDFQGKSYRLYAHVFENADDARAYYAARSGYSTELEDAYRISAYYFSTALYAFDGKNAFALEGGDFLDFNELVTELFPVTGEAQSTACGEVYDV